MDQTTTGGIGARNEARLLALLESDEDGGLTIAAMREHGIQDPGQAVYALQLAGHQIDRVNREDSDRHTGLAYRLRAYSATASVPVRMAQERSMNVTPDAIGRARRFLPHARLISAR